MQQRGGEANTQQTNNSLAKKPNFQNKKNLKTKELT